MADDPSISFVFFDLETTGCPQSGSIFHDYHRIVQISAVCGDQTFDAVVNPQCHIPSESTEIHRVKNSDVQASPTFAKIFPLFRAFIKKQIKRGVVVVLVAHNAFGFDKPMLEKECARFGLRIPPSWKFYDTLLKYRTQFSELSSKRLGDIYKERFGEDLTGAHNSLADSLALKRLFELDLRLHFTMDETLPVHEQRYLNDNEDVVRVRGIGQKTKAKLSRVLNIQDPTIGQLRERLVSGHSYAEIELFIRTQMNCYKEQFVFSILCEIVQPTQPHLLFQSFPFLQHTFTVGFSAETVNTLMIKHRIRSAEQLKRLYLFKFKECGEAWDTLLRDINVNPFHISMMMRSI